MQLLPGWPPIVLQKELAACALHEAGAAAPKVVQMCGGPGAASTEHSEPCTKVEQALANVGWLNFVEQKFRGAAGWLTIVTEQRDGPPTNVLHWESPTPLAEHMPRPLALVAEHDWNGPCVLELLHCDGVPAGFDGGSTEQIDVSKPLRAEQSSWSGTATAEQ